MEINFQSWCDLRIAIRALEQYREGLARMHGLTIQQLNLLICLRGDRSYPDVTIKRIADALAIRQHSVVALVNGAARQGLVERERGPGRRTVVRLTPKGEELARTIMLAPSEVIGWSEHASVIVLYYLEMMRSFSATNPIAAENWRRTMAAIEELAARALKEPSDATPDPVA